MALRINTNVASLYTHKNMILNDSKLTTSLERLSSGLRINKAADDSSGMAISDTLKHNILASDKQFVMQMTGYQLFKQLMVLFKNPSIL